MEEQTQLSQAQNPQSIQVENMLVNPRERREIVLADVDGMFYAIKSFPVTAVVWNEESISLVLKDLGTSIKFVPQINPSIGMFFLREDKRVGHGFFEKGIRIWEGDYEPVQFTKSNLINFVRHYDMEKGEALVQSVRELKLTVSKTTIENMMDVNDEDNFDLMESNRRETNLPRKFSLKMPIAYLGQETVFGSLDFEARVVNQKDRYGNENDGGRKIIELRCVNVREVLREMMIGVLKRLPEGTPQYYGRLNFVGDGRY